MKKAALLSILVVGVQIAVEVIAEAQQPKKVPRIGYVGAGSPITAGHHAQAFAQGVGRAWIRGGVRTS